MSKRSRCEFESVVYDRKGRAIGSAGSQTMQDARENLMSLMRAKGVEYGWVRRVCPPRFKCGRVGKRVSCSQVKRSRN